jgi:hypothetical protein
MSIMKVNSNNQLPKARHEKLIVKELPDETLVYDLVNDKAHCLNETAGKVWKNCDGSNSAADISAILAEEAGAQVDEAVVWLALDQLEKFKLLEAVPSTPAHLVGINRRQLVRTMGIAALALPVIISITTQTAQAQASPCSTPNRPDGCPCTTNGQCIPSHKCAGGFCAP